MYEAQSGNHHIRHDAGGVTVVNDGRATKMTEKEFVEFALLCARVAERITPPKTRGETKQARAGGLPDSAYSA